MTVDANTLMDQDNETKKRNGEYKLLRESLIFKRSRAVREASGTERIRDCLVSKHSWTYRSLLRTEFNLSTLLWETGALVFQHVTD